MRKVTIFLPNGEVHEWEKGQGNVNSIYDGQDAGHPTVRVVFDDDTLKVYKGCPFVMDLPVKPKTDRTTGGGYYSRSGGSGRNFNEDPRNDDRDW